MLEPATATFVHHRLGLSPSTLVFDISNACLGFLDGMVMLANMIELGQVENGLVVSGETAETLLASTLEALCNDHSLTRKSVKMAVAWGLEHRDLTGITAIGTDEICWRKRKDKFVTLVYQLDQGRRRLLWIGSDRTAKTFRDFFDWLGQERCQQLRFICSDMWKPYLSVIAEKAAGAVNVLDRFHIMSHMGKAIDEVRANEVKELKSKGKDPLLTRSRWCLLKRPENLTDNQVDKLKDLLAYNLRTIRAYLLKEDFQQFWTYSSPTWAGKFLDAWCTRTMRSKLKPMKKVAKMLRAHRPLLLNWFSAKGAIALGCVEGFNNKAKVVTKRSYGFRTYDGLKIALYHGLGDLPTPKATHRFC